MEKKNGLLCTKYFYHLHMLGSSALHTAARSGHAECIVKMLQYKVRVGSQDPEKMTALHHAGENFNPIRNNFSQVLKKFIFTS
jgi:hypothetical protein